MNRTENLLRDAIRDTAAQVTPDSILPLDLARPRAQLPAPRHRRVLPVLGPVTAIAAVALIVVAAVAQHPAGQAPALISGGAPPYYIALTTAGPPPAHQPFANPPMDITVRATRTSTVLATVKPPVPYRTFTLISGTADDTTFLAGASAQTASITSPEQFYLLRFRADTRQVTLTPLHVRPSLTTMLDAASLSTDGRYLAMTSDSRLAIQDLRTGAVHSWTTRVQGYISWDHSSLELSWTSGDRGLSFIWTNGNASLRLLNPASNADLLGASKLLVPNLSFTGKGFACTSNPFAAAGGAVVLCGGYPTSHGGTLGFPTGEVTTGFGESSARTGTLLTILDPKKEHLPTPLVEQQFPKPHRVRVVDLSKLPHLYWASPDAGILIGDRDGKAFIFDDGQEQAIGWSHSIATPIGMNGAAVAW
jgi:hypothetical protein